MLAFCIIKESKEAKKEKKASLWNQMWKRQTKQKEKFKCKDYLVLLSHLKNFLNFFLQF
jgi:phenylalanine-4-hydroxylase